MKIESVSLLINKMCTQQNYAKCRILIQKEWDRITEAKNYQMLNDEAKQFLKIIKQEREMGTFHSLTNTEKKILILFNQSIKEMKLPFAKRLFIQHKELIDSPKAQDWLTSDTKFICHAWKQNT
ncbi:MAG: hypothetical protein Q8906_10260 [Bacillota bacterium]|nr:hypothetical protein [Bacillota bacterium]